MKRILLVEDSQDEQDILKATLSSQGVITPVATLKEALTAIETEHFDLIIMDVSLPDGEGFKICSMVQQSEELKAIPIVFITGRFGLEDKVMAFSLGAHDYIVKPYEIREVKARVTALLKRLDHNSKVDQIKIGDLKISPASQRVYLCSESQESLLDLTRIEYKLLMLFARRQDQLLSRDQIISAVWADNVHITDRAVDTHISHLRKKIKGSKCRINSVYGEGYRLSLSSHNGGLDQLAA